MSNNGGTPDNGTPAAKDPITQDPSNQAPGNTGGQADPSKAAPDQSKAAPDQSKAAPADNWDKDWRKNYAGEDEKMLKRLERYQSPRAVIDALVAAQTKIDSGELKSAKRPGKDASPEELAAWRTENGVPESPEKYSIELGEGRVFGEQDAPVLASFLKTAHEGGFPQEMVTQALRWYHQLAEENSALQDEADRNYKQKATDEIRAEWGADFRRNVNAALSLFDSAPAELKENLMFARLADGTPLTSNPIALRWLCSIASELNPVSTLLPATDGNAIGSAESRLAEIQALMGDRDSKYWKGPEAEKLQAEFRNLTAAVEKLKARA